MKIYQFAVWKRTGYVNSGDVAYRWHTPYTIRAEDELSETSLAYIATSLVTAERVMLFERTDITHVTAYEVERDKLYSSSTVTHTFGTPTFDPGQPSQLVTGLRPGAGMGPFYGLQWRRNMDEGPQFRGYLGGCVGMDDCVDTRRRWWGKRKIALLMKAPLASECWKLYRALLVQVPKLQNDFEVDRFGKVKQYKGFTSGRLIHFVTDNQRLRMHHHKRGFKSRFVESVLETATDKMLKDLRFYRERMLNYSHRWYKSADPIESVLYRPFLEVAAIWITLCWCFGYDLENRDYFKNGPNMSDDLDTMQPAHGTVYVKHAHRQIHTCLMELFAAHQKLCRFYGVYNVDHDEEVLDDSWGAAALIENTTTGEQAYIEWDEWTATIFKVCDCINVLNKILIVDEPRLKFPQAQEIFHPPFLPQPIPFYTYPQSVTIDYLTEFYPLPREPYIVDDLPTETVVRVPEEPQTRTVIAWDHTIHEDDDPYSENAFKKAVKEVLEKFETIRQWVGKIRVQMPWYRGIPIEKLPPEHKDKRNPFTGEPIPNDP